MRMEIELLVIGNNLPLGGKLVPIALYMPQQPHGALQLVHRRVCARCERQRRVVVLPDHRVLGPAQRHLGVSVSGSRGGLDACCSGGMDQCKVIALVDKCNVSRASEIGTVGVWSDAC
jgi:hypothetical protein